MSVIVNNIRIKKDNCVLSRAKKQINRNIIIKDENMIREQLRKHKLKTRDESLKTQHQSK